MNSLMSTPKHSETDLDESKSKLSLLLKLDTSCKNRLKDLPCGDKFPGIDGYMNVLNENFSLSGLHFNYQLKSTKSKKKKYYDCKREFLNICRINKIPIILILVNSKLDLFFWEYINESYIKNILKLDDDKKSKTRRVKFLNVIEKDFIDKIINICKNHSILYHEQKEFFENLEYMKSQKTPIDIYTDDKFKKQQTTEHNIDKFGYFTVPYSVKLNEEETNEIKKIKNKLFKSIKSISDKFIIYQGLIYLIGPVYLDRRGDIIRLKIKRLLSINNKEEKLILDNLLNLKLIIQKGNLVYVNNKERSKKILNELLDKNDLNLNKLANIFIYE